MEKFKKFIPLILGIILVAVGIFVYFRTGELKRVCTEKATATVVNMREDFTTEVDSDGYRYIYYPIIEYQANGNRVTAEISAGSNPPSYSINDTVEILYNPNNTGEFIIAGSNSDIVWIILVGLGVVFAGAGVYIAVKK